MIRMITENDIPFLKSMCKKDLFVSRIISIYNAYGETDLGQFWVQTDEGRLNAVFCLLDGVLTMSFVCEGNMDELEGFLYAVDASVIVCNAEFALKHFPNHTKTGPILHYDNSEILECEFNFDRNPSLKELYAVMQSCKSASFMPPPWEPFYLDMSHRIRHGCALSVGVRNEKGVLCGAGFTVAQTDHNAILGGICTLPNERRKGYGKMVVAALLSQLHQDDIYVFRGADENREFYDMIGFTECGTWAEIRR